MIRFKTNMKPLLLAFMLVLVITNIGIAQKAATVPRDFVPNPVKYQSVVPFVKGDANTNRATRTVLVDPSPLPSGGSGVDGGLEGSAHWAELDDFVAGIPASALLQSDPMEAFNESVEAFTPASRISFNGVINSPVTTVPPDTHLAVGPGLADAGRVVMVTNGGVEIWDKNGSVIAGRLFLDSMFSTNVFDPKIIFDRNSSAICR